MVMEATATPGPTVTASFEKLLLSTVRLSGAATLYGVQQIESAASVLQGDDSFSKQVEKFGATVESLTQCIVEEISPGKKDALDSIASVTGQVVRQSIQGASFLDPREIIRLANNLAQKSTETLSGWTRKKEPASEEKPRLAVDVLSN